MLRTRCLALLTLCAALSAQQTPPAAKNYVDWGGTGEPLVLIPSNCDPADTFSSLAPHLVKNFHVITLTSTGCNSTSGNQADNVVALLDALGFQRANLVGHASAGAEVIRMAGVYPYRVRRIITLDAIQAKSPANTFTKHPALILVPSGLDRDQRRQLNSFRKNGLDVEIAQLKRSPEQVAKQIIHFVRPQEEPRYSTPPPFTR